jgi:hypothetical protein
MHPADDEHGNYFTRIRGVATLHTLCLRFNEFTRQVNEVITIPHSLTLQTRANDSMQIHVAIVCDFEFSAKRFFKLKLLKHSLLVKPVGGGVVVGGGGVGNPNLQILVISPK